MGRRGGLGRRPFLQVQYIVVDSTIFSSERQIYGKVCQSAPALGSPIHLICKRRICLKLPATVDNLKPSLDGLGAYQACLKRYCN
jgi:hypothetical protein